MRLPLLCPSGCCVSPASTSVVKSSDKEQTGTAGTTLKPRGAAPLPFFSRSGAIHPRPQCPLQLQGVQGRPLGPYNSLHCHSLQTLNRTCPTCRHQFFHHSCPSRVSRTTPTTCSLSPQPPSTPNADKKMPHLFKLSPPQFHSCPLKALRTTPTCTSHPQLPAAPNT